MSAHSGQAHWAARGGGGSARSEPMEAAGPQPGPGPAAGPQPGAEEIDMSLGRSGGARVPARAAGPARGREGWEGGAHDSARPGPARGSVRPRGRSRRGAPCPRPGPGVWSVARMRRGGAGRVGQRRVVWPRSAGAPRSACTRSRWKGTGQEKAKKEPGVVGAGVGENHGSRPICVLCWQHPVTSEGRVSNAA